MHRPDYSGGDPRNYRPLPGGASHGADGNIALTVAGCASSFFMLASLFLPWAQIQMWTFGISISYARLCQMAMSGVSQFGGAMSNAVGQQPRVLFVLFPLVAVVLAAAGSLLSVTSRNQPRLSGALMVASGGLGCIGSTLLFQNLSGAAMGLALSSFLGSGFWLFAVSSLALACSGLYGIIRSAD